MNYLDFDLQLEATSDGAHFRARLLASPAGQAESYFILPFDEKDLYIFVLSVGQTRLGVRKLDSEQMRLATELGSKLYSAVFQNQIQSCFLRSLDEAEKQGAGLRLRLRLDSALINLPWEFLYDTTHRRFLSHSNRTPIVRFLDLPQRISGLSIAMPLKVLVMIASPNDHRPLNVEQEWGKVKDAVRDLEERGVLQLVRLEDGTLATLRRKLLKEQFHIFHYIGHGAYDVENEEGVLLLEDENGRGRRINGSQLGMLLHDHASLRLVLLNACDGARTSIADPFAGVAQHLVLQGLPAVIAMQFEITDQAAITLAQAFYDALATGIPVDAALAEARKAIFAEGNDVEWGTPVLYMRAHDGRLFDLKLQPAKRAWRPTDGALQRAKAPSRFRAARQAFYNSASRSWVTRGTTIRLSLFYAFSLLLILLTAALNLGNGGRMASQQRATTTSPPHSTVVEQATATQMLLVNLPKRQTALMSASTVVATSTATEKPTQTEGAPPSPTITSTPFPPSPSPTAEATQPPTPTDLPKPTAMAQPTVSATVTSQPSPSPIATVIAATTGQVVTGWVELTSGIPFVFVPAGQFVMGSSNADVEASDDEKPAHTNKTAAFWIARTEVTNAQFRPFVEGDGYSNRAYWTPAGWSWRGQQQIVQPSCWNDPAFNQANQPVVCVSWYEAIAFANWLSTQSGASVRLPSEAEWEKAARGADGLLYPWGNQFVGGEANYCDVNCSFGWKQASVNDGFARIAAVGSYAKNISPYGAVDMAGNAGEWTSTLYRGYPYKADDEREALDAEGIRSVRGGSWSNRSLFLRGADRFQAEPSARNDNLGFRIVVEAVPGQ